MSVCMHKHMKKTPERYCLVDPGVTAVLLATDLSSRRSSVDRLKMECLERNVNKILIHIKK